MMGCGGSKPTESEAKEEPADVKDVGLALTKPDAAPADTKASLAEKAKAWNP